MAAVLPRPAGGQPQPQNDLQNDVNSTLIYILDFQREHGRAGVHRLIYCWDMAGLVEGFELRDMLPNPNVLVTTQVARAQVSARAQADSRADMQRVGGIQARGRVDQVKNAYMSLRAALIHWGRRFSSVPEMAKMVILVILGFVALDLLVALLRLCGMPL